MSSSRPTMPVMPTVGRRRLCNLAAVLYYRGCRLHQHHFYPEKLLLMLLLRLLLPFHC